MAANPILRAALEYHARGWSLIPMAKDAKQPARKWKRYQRRQASESTLRRWFASGELGIAVIFGEASGGLASRDFDDTASYEAWRDAHPQLATELPTVETRRGFHVYCRAWPESVLEARRRLGKASDGIGAITLGDGELRASRGCYSVLPPSIHPQGHVYRWIIPLPNGELPEVDLCEVGFFNPVDDAGESSVENGVDPESFTCNREDRELQSVQKQYTLVENEGDNSKRRDENGFDLESAIENALSESLPSQPGQRHRQVFDLARALKAIPAIADADPGAMRPYVTRWHRRALPFISTKPLEETWIDFVKAWPKVLFPKGAEPMVAIVERARAAELPEVAHQYEQDELRLLIALCRELQRESGDKPFYLACRRAGELLGVDKVTANRWLFLLATDGVLEEVEKGTAKSRKATRYRYLAD